MILVLRFGGLCGVFVLRVLFVYINISISFQNVFIMIKFDVIVELAPVP